MTVFVVRHQHAPHRCPAADFHAGAGLLNHLSRSNAARHGVRIHGEAVLQAQHTLVMIAEAASADELRAFLAPLAQAGTLELEPAASCATVVASGGCAVDVPTLDAEVPALDPEDACQSALSAGLVVHRAHPLNAETSIPALIGAVVMPNAHFYVRNHFQNPDLDPVAWRLEIGGLVTRPLTLSLRDLRAMPSQTSVVTLECAGNGRASLDPPVPGEPWGLGAVSTAEWTGVPLTDVLDRAGVDPPGSEVVFRGADRGSVEGRDAPIHFERSLPVAAVSGTGALLAYAMNGEALPVQHGFPLRLIVPGWYAVASVKWLTRIDVVAEPFMGHYQAEKYMYEWDDGRAPVAVQQVRSLVVEPGDGQELAVGEVVVRGVAWSGEAPIARVEVRVADGPWQRAALLGEGVRGRWQWWQLPVRLDSPGPAVIRARATDAAGRSQPEEQRWNRQGYGNNAVQAVRVTVRPR